MPAEIGRELLEKARNRKNPAGNRLVYASSAIPYLFVGEDHSRGFEALEEYRRIQRELKKPELSDREMDVFSRRAQVIPEILRMTGNSLQKRLEYRGKKGILQHGLN